VSTKKQPTSRLDWWVLFFARESCGIEAPGSDSVSVHQKTTHRSFRPMGPVFCRESYAHK